MPNAHSLCRLNATPRHLVRFLDAAKLVVELCQCEPDSTIVGRELAGALIHLRRCFEVARLTCSMSIEIVAPVGIWIDRQRAFEFNDGFGISIEMVKGYSMRGMRFRERWVELKGFCARVENVRDSHVLMIVEVEKKGGIGEAGIGPGVCGIDLDGLHEHALSEEHMRSGV